MQQQILDAADSPRDLEALYRENPSAFTDALAPALAQQPGSLLLQAWHERLFYNDRPGGAIAPTSRWNTRDIRLVAVLVLIGGSFLQLHWLLDLDWNLRDEFFERSTPSTVAGALIVYLALHRKCSRLVLRAVAVVFACAVLFLLILPFDSKAQSVFLSILHMPVAYVALAGVLFTGGAWRDSDRRLSFVRYCGEWFILSSVLALGMTVLGTLTTALFEFADMDISYVYWEQIMLYAIVAVPLVALMLVDQVVAGRFRIAPLLAAVFTPLFLVTLLVYLAVVTVSGKDPFNDRDFLIVLNMLLMIVLGLCVFSVTERHPARAAGVFDFMSVALVAVTLVINGVALSAILFRLGSLGLTPNRIAVLGLNLLVFAHLAGIAWHYTRFLRKRGTFGGIEKWIVTWIPVYVVWCLIVAVGFPLIFWFK
jgi:hypothetical protein